MSTLVLSNAYNTLTVETDGARLVSYVPAHGDEVMARLADGSGGMPICWPWFSGHGPKGCRRHGLARYCPFKVVRRDESPLDSALELELVAAEETLKAFDFAFRLRVVYRLTDRLEISLAGTNLDKRPFAVTEMFHPYFRVGDVSACRVKGLGEERIAAGPRIVDLPEVPVHAYSLMDPVLGRELKFTSTGDCAAVVWNPGERPATAVSSALAPGEWRRFVCVENGTALPEQAYVLQPGQSHTLTRTIQVVETCWGQAPFGVGLNDLFS